MKNRLQKFQHWSQKSKTPLTASLKMSADCLPWMARQRTSRAFWAHLDHTSQSLAVDESAVPNPLVMVLFTSIRGGANQAITAPVLGIRKMTWVRARLRKV